jgi:serine/threonine protein kinase
MRSSAVSSVPPPLPFELLKQYEVMECLSHSDRSETYLVKSRDSGEYFIAKLYQKPYAAGGDEGAILARLDHPAIPKAADCFETADTFCVLREYADGLPLDRLDTPLEERRVLDIGSQLCGILTYLHGQTPPIIHRDVKPHNVILSPENRVHLIDFGISRQFSENAPKDTALFVTEGYAPPEQYGYKQTDCRADIYSLGVLLCFLLTGKQDLDALDGLPNQKLARVIRKCAEFSPKDRYLTAAAAKKALLGTAKKALQWGRIATVSLVLLTAAAVLAVWQSSKPPVEEGAFIPPETIVSQPSREPSPPEETPPPPEPAPYLEISENDFRDFAEEDVRTYLSRVSMTPILAFTKGEGLRIYGREQHWHGVNFNIGVLPPGRYIFEVELASDEPTGFSIANANEPNGAFLRSDTDVLEATLSYGLLIEDVDGVSMAVTTLDDGTRSYQEYIRLQTRWLGEDAPQPDFVIRSIRVYDADDRGITFTPGSLGYTAYIDFRFDTTVDLSGYEYLLADLKFTGEGSLKTLGQLWMVVSHRNYNVYLTAFGYAEGDKYRPAGDDVTGRAEGEWFTAWFPIHGSYSFGSRPESCDFTSIDMLRYEVVYGIPGQDVVPPGAAYSVKNIRVSNSTDGADAMPIPIVGDGVRYGGAYGELIGLYR